MAVPPYVRRLSWIALALLLVACSGSGAALPPTPTAGSAVPATSKTVLVLWYAWAAPEQRALLALIERFNRAHPQVQIVAQSRPAVSITADFASAVAEGAGPHLVILPSHVLGGLVALGSLQPLDGLLADAELVDLLPAGLAAAQISSATGSALYGFPITFDTLALYYNKANVLRPPGDTGALFDAARSLTDTQSDPAFWGLAYNLSLDRTIGYMYAFGGQIFDDDRNLVLGLAGRSGAEAWLSWLAALHRDERLLASMDGMTVAGVLNTNAAPMTIDWSYALAEYRALWPDTLGVAPLPRLSDLDRPPEPYVQSDVLALNARAGDEAQRAACATFARFLLGDDAQGVLLRAGRQPILQRLDLASAPDLPADLLAAAAAFRAQAAVGRPMPNNPAANHIVWDVLADMQASAMRGLLTPAQAVSNAEANLRQRLGAPSGGP